MKEWDRVGRIMLGHGRGRVQVSEQAGRSCWSKFEERRQRARVSQGCGLCKHLCNSWSYAQTVLAVEGGKATGLRLQ
jgi:hypothetical protein